MVKKARKKAASSKTKRAKARATVRARSKVGSRARLKAGSKPRARKAARKPAPPAGIIARMESAIHAVVDGIRETAAMREKMHRPGMPDAT
jgi:hypothetical protein